VTDLEDLAARLAWWQPPAEALRHQERLLAQVMVYGTPDDLAVARRHFPESAFRAVLAQPPPGVFDPRSWAYWHVVFGLQPPGGPPGRALPD
jgi:hypothetical protein